jgi:hypothetical protein
LIVAGVAATMLLPGAQWLGAALIGAGVSGLEHDGTAAFNAVVNGTQEIDHAGWGMSLGIGAALGGLGGGGAFKYGGKIGAKALNKVGLEKIGGKLASKVAPKSVGKAVRQQSAKNIAKSFAKDVVKGIGKDAAVTFGKQMFNNVREGGDIFEGFAQAAMESVVGGVIKGGIVVINH